MTNKSKRHHYVPQSLLRGFCFESATLLLFDRSRPELGIQARNKRGAFQNFYENSFTDFDGNQNSAAEQEFARRYDNNIHEVIQKVAARNHSHSDLEFLAKFCVSWVLRSHSLRTHLFRTNGISKALREIQDQLRDESRLAHRIDHEMLEIGADSTSDRGISRGAGQHLRACGAIRRNLRIYLDRHANAQPWRFWCGTK